MDSTPTTRRLLSSRGLSILLVVVAVVVVTSAERYVDPVGDKYELPMGPGAADFTLAFFGARALVLGIDPYHNQAPELADPWRRHVIIDGQRYNVAYPPAHLLLYWPLAELTGDARQAGRILFWVNLSGLLVLSVLTWRLLLSACAPSEEERRVSLILVPLLFFALTENAGTSMCLERGQSNILNALFCWGAVFLFLRGKLFLATFLVVSAVLIKGYAVLLGLGLVLLGLRGRAWRSVLGGTALAALVWLAPVWSYLRDGLVGAGWMAVGPPSAFMNTRYLWLTQGFETFFSQLWPPLGGAGRVAMALVSLAATVASWVGCTKALGSSDRTAAPLWLCLFATTALATTLGYQRTNLIYSQILILPGVFVFLLMGEGYARAWGLTARGETALGVAQFALALLLFRFKFWGSSLSLSAIGLVLLVLTIAVGVLAAGLRGAAPAEHPAPA